MKVVEENDEKIFTKKEKNIITDPKDIVNIQKTLDMLDDDDDVQDVYHNWDE